MKFDEEKMKDAAEIAFKDIVQNINDYYKNIQDFYKKVFSTK
jgi:hypothetical protein